jgi:hypothetical protein
MRHAKLGKLPAECRPGQRDHERRSARARGHYDYLGPAFPGTPHRSHSRRGRGTGDGRIAPDNESPANSH